MLKRAAGIGAKLLASAVVIGLFFFLSARMPYFHPDKPISLAGFEPMTGNKPPAQRQTESLSLFDGEARFSGNFFDQASTGGFQMREVDVAGPCEGAGQRYLAGTCPNCSITPGIVDDGDPSTLLWIEGTGDQSRLGTIFKDCVTTLASGQVRVPLLSFNSQLIKLGNGGDAEAAVPLLANTVRTSQMSLGNWAIAVDNVSLGAPALEQMGLLLKDAGWSEVSQGEQKPSPMQRVFSSEDSRLCVVTLNQTDEAYQLVTIMDI